MHFEVTLNVVPLKGRGFMKNDLPLRSFPGLSNYLWAVVTKYPVSEVTLSDQLFGDPQHFKVIWFPKFNVTQVTENPLPLLGQIRWYKIRTTQLISLIRNVIRVHRKCNQILRDRL